MTSPALDGVRVLELGQSDNYAVPYATKLLADLGADVVMIEHGDGHPLRYGHPGLAPSPEISRDVFGFLAGNKRSVLLDVDKTSTRVIEQMISWADIVIASAEYEILSRIDTHHHLRPDAAFVLVSPWGADGPYRDRPVSPLTLQASAGWVTSRKEVGLWPVQVGGHLHEWASGAFIATSAMTARRAAVRGGTAVTVDFSMFECLHSMLCYEKLRYDARGELGVNRERILIAPFGIRPCADGWIGINTLTQQQWTDACHMTGLDHYKDQKLELDRGDGDLEAFGTQLEAFLADKRVNDLVELGQRLRIPVVPVLSGSDMSLFPQWVERPFFDEVGSGTMRHRQPGPPWRLYGTPTVGPGPGEAPAAGAHTRSVLQERVRIPGSGT